jgi:hypothetical protein
MRFVIQFTENKNSNFFPFEKHKKYKMNFEDQINLLKNKENNVKFKENKSELSLDFDENLIERCKKLFNFIKFI